MRAASILNEDGQGSYRFDGMALPGPFAILGFFLGYMSGRSWLKAPKNAKDGTATSSSYRKKTAQKEEIRSV